MRAVLGVAILLTSWSCGGASTSPSPSPSPTPTPPPVGVGRGGVAIVDGIVFHEPLLANRILLPAGPLEGAVVTITEGPAAGATLTTDATGTYHFELPAGSFRLRWSANFYETRDSDPMTALAGIAMKVPTVTLRQLANVPIPEWTISGSVVDGLGNPIAGVGLSSGIGLTIYISGQTGPDGRFLLTSTRQHPDPLSLSIGKTGYESLGKSIPCPGSCNATLNVRLRRIIQEFIDAPASIRVGDVVAVDWVRNYDDGSVDRNRAASLVSSNTSVLQVQDLVPPYQHVFVKALMPGMATLTLGAGLPTPVSVYP